MQPTLFSRDATAPFEFRSLNDVSGLASLAELHLRDHWLLADDRTTWYRLSEQRMLWEPTDSVEVFAMEVQRILRTLLERQIEHATSQTTVLELTQALKLVANAGKLNAIVKQLRSSPALTQPGRLDGQNHLFPTRDNTVYDVRRRLTRPRRPTDYFTWASPARYPYRMWSTRSLHDFTGVLIDCVVLGTTDLERIPLRQPVSDSDRLAQWRQRYPNLMPILEQTFGTSVDLIRDFQVSGGYLLTGERGGKCFIIWHGSPDSGKSTWAEWFQAVMPQPACITLDRTAIVEREEHSKPVNRGVTDRDLVPLLGLPRAAFVPELQPGTVLRGKVLRPLAAQDRMTIRAPLAKRSVSVEPRTKIVADTNFKVAIADGDKGTFNRLFLVIFPFNFVSNPKHANEKLRSNSLAGDLLRAPLRDEAFAFFVDGISAMYDNHGHIPILEMSATGRRFRNTYVQRAGNAVGRSHALSRASSARVSTSSSSSARGQHTARNPRPRMVDESQVSTSPSKRVSVNTLAPLMEQWAAECKTNGRVHPDDADWEHTSMPSLRASFRTFAGSRGLQMPPVEINNKGLWGTFSKILSHYLPIVPPSTSLSCRLLRLCSWPLC